ncbi:hypothetical protein SRABI70_04849 [Pseudomonas sp. Bi70]|nr:hypothetical protein SRABI70_04849 [Pseudomonas sp. Bi70]
MIRHLGIDHGAGGWAGIACRVARYHRHLNAVDQGNVGGETPAASRVGSRLADHRTARAADQYRAAGLCRTAELDAIAGRDGRGNRCDGIDGGAGRGAAIAERVSGDRADQRAIGERR